MSDVGERAKAALEGVTPAPWHQRIAPAEGDQATHAEWLSGSLIGGGEPLHVLIAESPDPKFAYIVPAVTGDGPTSRINAEFIAAARTLVPELVDGLDAAMAEVVELRSRVGRVVELATKWDKAIELTTGNPSTVAKAFAHELFNALSGGAE